MNSPIEAIERLPAGQLSQIKGLINSIATSPVPHVRLALISIAQELVHAHFEGYKPAAEFWCDLASKHIKLLGSPPAPKSKERDQFNNGFLRLISRQSDGYKKFNFFELSIFLVCAFAETRESMKTDILESLTPFQRDVLAWVQSTLLGEVSGAPESNMYAPAAQKPGKEINETEAQKIWQHLFTELVKRTERAEYMDSFLPVFPEHQKARFHVFRLGLNSPNIIVQTYLSVSRLEGGLLQYTHVYKEKRKRTNSGKRVGRGFSIPTTSALYLFGFNNAPAITKKGELNVDLKQPAELIVLPSTALLNRQKVTFGLTISTNDKGSMLASRIAVRATTLTSDSATNIGLHHLTDLAKLLEEIVAAEKLQAGPETSNSKSDPQASNQDDGFLTEEAQQILSGINNRIRLLVPSKAKDLTAAEICDVLESFTPPIDVESLTPSDFRMGSLGIADH